MRGTDSAERVVAVLDRLASAPEGLGVTDLARQLDIHKTTASRLLATLALTGIVEREPATRRYRLGARLVSLAGAAVARLPVVSQARPELEHLAATAMETANLAILDGRHVVYVDQVVPADAVVMASWVGRRSPAHASSSGKVLLAFGDDAVREAVLASPLEELTAQTITDPQRLRVVLDETRKRGYAAGVGELEDGLVTVAAPVVVGQRAVGAISLSGPSFRIPPRDQPHLGRLLVDAASAISRRMGGQVTE
jgi:DNA-binding IclR family transcriptional regulator